MQVPVQQLPSMVSTKSFNDINRPVIAHASSKLLQSTNNIMKRQNFIPLQVNSFHSGVCSN